MLKNLKLKNLYNSKEDRLIDDFYIPSLSKAIKYDRISAYFDSKILRMYSSGIEELIKNNGKVRFIFSSEISDEDYKLMKKGYELRKIYEERLLNSLSDEDVTVDLSNLSYLISQNVVDIKIALTKEGIFHDKYGLIYDSQDDVVYFRGSNNETVAAITKNYESFETTLFSSSDENEKNKINYAINNFERIWNNSMEGIITINLPEIVMKKIESFSSGKINQLYLERDNSLVFDFINNDKFIIINNLDSDTLISNNSPIYNRKIKHTVDYIENNIYYLKELSYLKVQKLIDSLKEISVKYNFNLFVTSKLRDFLFDKDIMIDKRKNLGIAIKKKDSNLISEFNKFKNIVDLELSRELRNPQMWDAFHIAKMIKSANFSVPGSGKTSIVYGAFAYLSKKNLVDKIVMIGPKNSFSSWKKEFVNNFGEKRTLNFLDIQEQSSQRDKRSKLKYEYEDKNLILINYESTVNLVDVITRILDEKTLLVFDEIHRIKGIDGVRANACLKFSEYTKYKVALTGTPIPNSYADIYNLLNVLYTEEYETFFNFNHFQLKSAYKDKNFIGEINNKIYPFFCRITKKELEIPEAYEDDCEKGYLIVDEIDKRIMEIVYNTYSNNYLLLYIRLMQASSNPELILEKIDIKDFSEDNQELTGMDYSNFNEKISEDIQMSDEDYNYIKNNFKTRKIDLTVDIIEENILLGNKIIAWGVFVKNLVLLKNKLTNRGIKSEIISGEVPQEERDRIIEDYENGMFDVLITNPHTLAESISLHKTCHHAIYFEYSFNLTHMIQSRDRIHRLGISEEERPKYTYMFLSSKDELYNTIDEKIYLRLKEKERIMNQAVESKEIILVEDNYLEDIKYILGLDK